MTNYATLALSLVLSLLASFPALADSPTRPEGKVVHVVVLWLDNNSAQVQQSLVEATKGLEAIPGVLETRVGPNLVTTDEEGDTPFSLALFMVFDNASSLEAFFDHPLHRALLESDAMSGLLRLETYQFIDSSPRL